MAASRKSAAARLEDRRVRDDSNLPPDILLPGARQSQEVKCFALFQARRSVPHSATSFRASEGPRPWIWVRSVPRTPYKAARTSKDGALTWLRFTRAFGSTGTSPLAFTVSAATAASSLPSHSSILA